MYVRALRLRADSFDLSVPRDNLARPTRGSQPRVEKLSGVFMNGPLNIMRVQLTLFTPLASEASSASTSVLVAGKWIQGSLLTHTTIHAVAGKAASNG